MIEWTEETWNPIAGCSKVSAGCANCYAEKMAARLEAMGVEKYHGLTVLQGSKRVWTGKIAFDEKALLAPLKRKKPTTYFVNSMSDLFHENMTDEQIDRIFAVMALCPQHTFQMLTKRPERMAAYFRGLASARISDRVAEFVARLWNRLVNSMPQGFEWSWRGDGFVSISGGVGDYWPLPNVWLGISVENQATADERIPLLLETPAAVRFISAEPLLESIDLIVRVDHSVRLDTLYQDAGLDWVIVGGESGPGARPCNIEWARSIVRQCKDAGVPVFVKQLGAKPWTPELADFDPKLKRRTPEECKRRLEQIHWLNLRNPKGSDMSEWPEDLRVREMPWPSREFGSVIPRPADQKSLGYLFPRMP